MDNQFPIYKITFDEQTEMGVTAISLVDYPAIESDFLHFSKDEPQQMWRFANEEKREIVGAVLIPDKLIYRRNGDFEYFVTFQKEVIEDLAWSNFVRGQYENFTIMHEHSDSNPYHDLVSGIENLGNWIEDEDCNCEEYGFEKGTIPYGSWMMRLHISNDEVWQRIKDNELRGFSVELFASIEPLILKQQTNKKNTMSEKKLKINLVERFARFLMADEPEEQEQLEVKTYALKEDNSVSVAIDESGAVVFSDGREVVDGEYPLEGDLVLVITDGKGEVKQVEVKEDEKPTESPLDEVAELKEQFNAQLSEKDAQLVEANAKVEELTAQMEQFAVVKTEMEKTIAELKKENEALKSQIPSKVGDFNVNKTNEEAKPSRWAVYGE